ncbi:aspartyl protease family protein At5g10770 [Triticum aestivum]|uniref:aspartyl protease family protein At5g10770 n=1 Tax=Triticum aestivum TaxID=4565 RepID=UPI001D02975E|nr:aspartyl protease family protein At5g10770-like [Triticum aestivum]
METSQSSKRELLPIKWEFVSLFLSFDHEHNAHYLLLKTKSDQMTYLLLATQRTEQGFHNLVKKQERLEWIMKTKFSSLDVKVTGMATNLEKLKADVEAHMSDSGRKQRDELVTRPTHAHPFVVPRGHPMMHVAIRFSPSAHSRLKSSAQGTDDLQPLDLTLPTTLGTALDTLEYVITIGIGSPAVTQTMMIDTGSDVSWVRCNSTDGTTLFDPSKSTTYAPFSCSSAACTQLGNNGNNCSNSQCQYMVQYGDGSNTTGTYGSDTLALSASDTVKGFQFGCSHHEEGFNREKFDGLMGLGGDAQSLVSQTAATYGKSFSYCLPPTNRTSGFLTFGAPNVTSAFVTTPMLRWPRVPTFYGVLLQDISVGGTLLGIQPTVLSNGSVMDSGTILTRLPRRAYSALSSAFRSGMTRYPRAAPVGILDTCYDFTGLRNFSVPTVELVFDGGAVMDLDYDGIMISDCLAFAATSGVSIIGNVQQRTFEVLHDVGQGVFGFRFWNLPLDIRPSGVGRPRVVVIDDDAPPPPPVRHGDAGSSRGARVKEEKADDEDGGDDSDYSCLDCRTEVKLLVSGMD